MTRTLIFNSLASIAAARHLLSSPPLAYTPWVTWQPAVAVDGQPRLEVDIHPGRLSSGESDCLVPLLESFSTNGSFFDLQALRRLDEGTRQVAWQSIGIYAGCIAEVLS